MTKYYYDDPLQVAYMAREFGVKYQTKYMGIEGADIDSMYGELAATKGCVELRLSLFGLDAELGSMPKDKVYIHPDSLHIFEPQVGDMVLNNRVGGVNVLTVTDIAPRYAYQVHYSLAIELNLIIIQRQNKAFFMPKSEEL